MPSSTSSSDIPYRDVPERRWGQAWLLAAVLLVAAVAGWEAKARSMQHLPGDVDAYANFTIQWAEERRRLDQPGNGEKAVHRPLSQLQHESLPRRTPQKRE